MDIVYRHGEATAKQIHGDMENAPTYTTVRGLLRVLVAKGQLKIERAGSRYIYRPTVPKGSIAQSMLLHVVRTFFNGSATHAMTALLGSADVKFSEADIERLQQTIEELEARETKR